jgi:ABC-2 type transport system ATP-binding protein
MMIIKNLSKKIASHPILNEVQLTIPKGVICGIVGRNGSGKTTLFRTIVGHYQSDAGEVLIEGKNICIDPIMKEKIFYVDTQFHPLDFMTPIIIGEYYNLLYHSFDLESYQQMIQKYQLPNRRFQQYSKGMQGLLLVILAYCSNCDYLILDEPLDGLDVIIRKEATDLLLDAVSEGTRSIILSSHNLAELEKLVDQVAFLKNGRISHTVHLENEKQLTKKVQFVLRQKVIPEIIKQRGTILSVQGRVVCVVFKEYTAELAEQVATLNPVLIEELPLSLEDLFIEEFSHQDYENEMRDTNDEK